METISPYVLTFLLNAVWQAALVALVAAIASHFMRNAPASYRHGLWAAAVVMAAILPIVTVSRHERHAILPPSISVLPAPAPVSAAAARLNTASPARRSTDAAQIGFSESAATAIIWIYFAFLAFRVAAFARALVQTQRLRGGARPLTCTSTVDHVWERCRRVFGLAGVDLLTSSRVPGPVAVGAFRPAVIIPEHFGRENRAELLTAALGHEVAHIARRDFGFNILYELLSIPVSFHPAFWLMRREIEHTREMACDEAVTSRLLEAPVYARSIMTIADSLACAEPPAYTLGVFDGNILESRIRRVLRRPAFNVKRARVLLATTVSALAICGIVASSVALTARAQSAYQSEMKQAAEAYNKGDYGTAVNHFTTATTLEPSNADARLFLANALMSEFYADRGTPDMRLVAAANEQYAKVLERDSANRQALAGMIAIAMDSKEFTAAREWAKKLAAVDPNDKTVWYTLGAVDWAIVYPEFQNAKKASGASPESYTIPDATIRKTLRDGYLAQVDEGLGALQKALALDSQYDQAMAYVNLLDRLKAGMVDDPNEAGKLIAKADELVGQAIAAKKQHANEPAPAMHAIDIDGPPPGPAGRQVLFHAPPPPPPPPPPDRINQPASDVPVRRPAPGEMQSPGFYWQITGAPGIAAIDLVHQLQAKGFSAVLQAGSDNLTRVVLGPYFDEESAKKAKDAAEAAGFHIGGK